MFSRIAAALTALGIKVTPFQLNGIGGDRIDQFGHRSRGKGKGSRQKSLLSMHYRLSSGRPHHARAWHNPDNKHQSSRIEAARMKRERKRIKCARDIEESFFWNLARDNDPNWLRMRQNPMLLAS